MTLVSGLFSESQMLLRFSLVNEALAPVRHGICLARLSVELRARSRISMGGKRLTSRCILHRYYMTLQG